MLYFVAFALLILVEQVSSICSTGQFWNPLNNACVNCNKFR